MSAACRRTISSAPPSATRCSLFEAHLQLVQSGGGSPCEEPPRHGRHPRRGEERIPFLGDGRPATGRMPGRALAARPKGRAARRGAAFSSAGERRGLDLPLRGAAGRTVHPVLALRRLPRDLAPLPGAAQAARIGLGPPMHGDHSLLQDARSLGRRRPGAGPGS